MTLFGGFLIYLGLIGAAAGVISLVKPLRFLRIRSRRRGALIAGLGLLAFVAGVWLPLAETRVEAPRTRLDEFAPAWQFSEFHSVRIDAPAARVHRAIRAVTPEEIRFYRTLTWIRGFGRRGPQGILNPPPGRPILDTFLSGAFVPLADDADREIVFGRGGDGWGRKLWTADEFKQPHGGQFVRIAMNFRIVEVDAAHSTLTTETRVYVAGPQAVRGFAAYWRMISPGSALIRREWLRAIKLRAEGPAR
jgi:hypothetical protein